MKPIKFPEANIELAKSQSQYHNLPACQINDTEGTTITQWQLSIKERLKIVFTGKLWLTQLTFKQPLQPQLPSTKLPFKRNLKPEDIK